MYRVTDTIKPTPSPGGVTVRLTAPADSPGLVRLAALDSAPAPAGPTVVAEVDGELVAALPLSGGRALADPFHRTAALVQMLELRAEQLRAAGPAPSRRARGLVRGLRPAH